MKKILYTALSLLIAISITACEGALQLNMPTITPSAKKAEAKEEAKEASYPDVVSTRALDSLQALQLAYEEIYNKVLPSVVSISVIISVQQELPSVFPFEFGDSQQTPEFQQQAAGSGFVWDREGHIITNNHVVENADVIKVQFSDGTMAMGELIGSDASSDLAVIYVDVPEDKLVPVEIVDSTTLRIGQIAIAVGNPFRLDGSMTTGIVSGLGRSLDLQQTDLGAAYTIPDIIQTDAPINPGNSGGVLVDIEGRLMGVTTAIESPVRANAGVGYAIPSIIVQKIVPFLIEEGSYQQPWIGISGRTLTPELADAMRLEPSQNGALVIDVIGKSPADEVGLLGSDKTTEIYGQEVRVGGDVITAIQGKPVADFEDLVAYLARYTNVGDTITLTLLREGQEMQVDLTLAARPGTGTEEERPPQTAGAWLGVFGVELTPPVAEEMDLDTDTNGVLIQEVISGSPADQAGLRGSYKTATINGTEILIGGDVITMIDGEQISTMQDLVSEIRSREPGDEVTLTIIREREESEVAVTLEEIPQ